MVKRMGGSLFAAVAGLALLLGVAFNVTDSRVEAAPEDDIAQVVANAVTAWNNKDAAKFITYFTDNGLEAQFGVTRDEAAEVIAEEMKFTGAIADYSVTDIRTASGNGFATVEIEFEVGFVLYEEWRFYFIDGGWKIDESSQLFRPLPPGVPVVQMDLDEYAFIYDENAVKSGNFAFSVRNIGEEEHEIVAFKITGDGSMLEILMAADEESEDLPEGLEFVGFGGYYAPGETEGTAVFNTPLDAGRYGLICFVPAPDGTPHAFLGMVSEFTVGAAAPAPTPAPGGTITPPSTGDAGIAGGASTEMLGIAAIGALLVLAGLAGATKAYVRH